MKNFLLRAAFAAFVVCAGAAQAQELGKPGDFNSGGNSMTETGAAAQREETSRITDQKYSAGPGVGESERIGAEYRLGGLTSDGRNLGVRGQAEEPVNKRKQEARKRRRKIDH